MTNYVGVLDNSKTNGEGHYKFLNKVFAGGVSTGFSATGFQVVQRGAGANMSVDVSIGHGILERPTADYAFDVWSDAATNVTITTAPVANSRIDAIVAWVDTSVTTTASNNSPGALKFSAIVGTVAGSPVAPVDSAIQTSLGATVAWTRLANVTVGTSVSSIVTANISDVRTSIGSRVSRFVDVNGKNELQLASVASAVNAVTVTNAATGSGPIISATGTDTNIDINFAPKGTGQNKGLVDHLYNPSKFSVYRNAAYTTVNSTETVFPFDTKNFDTASNVDIVTNKGRATVITPGFYQWNTNISFASSVTVGYVLLRKNGTTNITRGQDIRSSVVGLAVSTFVQLAANDYIEVYYFTNAAVAADVSSVGNCTFSGFLVSTT